jgi:hypothetical protein
MDVWARFSVLLSSYLAAVVIAKLYHCLLALPAQRIPGSLERTLAIVNDPTK